MTRYLYVGSTPGADSSDYDLFNTVTAFPGASVLAMLGEGQLELNLAYDKAGYLKLYKSQDRGASWAQVAEEQVFTPAAATYLQRYYNVSAHRDTRLVWTNGGTAQTTWVVDVETSANWYTWTPANITGIANWWRHDMGVTGNPVSAWTDQVGGVVAAQGTGGLQPTVGATGIVFDGTDDYLTIDGAVLAQPFTAIVVCTPGVLAGSYGWTCDSGGAAGRVAFPALTKAGAVVGMYAGGALPAIGTYTAGSIMSCVGVFNGASSYGRVNGVQSAAVNPGSQGWDRIRMGAELSLTAGYFYKGSISEVILVSGAISSADLGRLSVYTQRRYGVVS